MTRQRLAGCALLLAVLGLYLIEMGPVGGRLAYARGESIRPDASVKDVARSADHPARGFVYSPYKHLTIAMNPSTHVISTAVDGAVAPIVAGAASLLPPGVTALTWAFATGECGAESWEELDAQAVAYANVAAFDNAGIDYIVSTGGAAGIFTCRTDQGMNQFIARSASPHLVGIDFDIEAGQTAEDIDALVQRVKAAQRRYPKLRFSFTLATLAASDGSLGSLNRTGEWVMEAIRNRGLADYFVNLMVMDYGAAIPANCVVSAGVCDMGRSAIQAVQNVNKKYGVPLARIELTPMIGVNDVIANVFTLDDARVMADYVRDNQLAGVHFWSLDRDTPCVGASSSVSSVCSNMSDVPSRAFIKTLYEGLRSREDADRSPTRFPAHNVVPPASSVDQRIDELGGLKRP